MMGVSERTIRRWIKAGKLRAYKPGRDYRIPESGLRQFVEESEISPKAESRFSLEQPPLNGFLAEERLYSEPELGTESWPYQALDSWVRIIRDLIADYDPIIGGLPERPSGEEYRQLRMLLVPFLKQTASINKALYESGMVAASNYLWEAVRAGEPVPQDLERKLREFHEVLERLNAEFPLPAREWLQRLPEKAELHSGKAEETVERWRQELQAAERQADRIRNNETA